MKRYILLFIAFISLIACKNQSQDAQNERSVYYFIRHAEKDVSNPNNKNPDLTYQGEERARFWGKYFDSIPLDKIYTTPYKRTIETALPIAARHNIKLDTYDPESIINPNFFIITKGKQVLIVGHSNTTPFLVNEILGEDKYASMDDSDHSSLFKITLMNGKATAEVISVDF